MFVHTVTFATVRSYLAGLAAGLRLAGVEWSWDDYHAAAQARGWDPTGNIGILRDFTRHGLSDEEMVRELIAVESDAYLRALARQQRHAEPGASADGIKLSEGRDG
jgi:hypothetical protein